MKRGYIYILTTKYNTVFYTGVTSNLPERIHEHKTDVGSKFTRKYKIKKLIWFDEYPTIRDAIDAEKRIKKWKRRWKEEMIEELNPDYSDLYEEIL
ncbi:GIY-YIG nuclease family protein [soil metagenome]